MAEGIEQAPGACGCGTDQVCVIVDQCGPPLIAVAGATVTISQSGTVLASGTTDALGQICLSGAWLMAGTYHLEATKSGLSTFSDNFTYSGTGTHSSGAYIVPLTSSYVWHITGCAGADLPGATITINGGTYTTDANGKVYLSFPDGTYPYTISKTRFNSTTDTLTALHCGGANPVTRSVSGAVANIGGAAPGYQCFGCNEPISETLHLTDAVLGAVTLTYDGVSAWVGDIVVNFPGNTGAHCGAPPFSSCAAKTGVRVRYGLSSSGGTPTLAAGYTADAGSFFSIHCPGTDVGQSLTVTVPTFVSLTCSPFQANFTHDQCDCSIIAGCLDPNYLWPGASAIVITITE